MGTQGNSSEKSPCQFSKDSFYIDARNWCRKTTQDSAAHKLSANNA